MIPKMLLESYEEDIRFHQIPSESTNLNNVFDDFCKHSNFLLAGKHSNSIKT